MKQLFLLVAVILAYGDGKEAFSSPAESWLKLKPLDFEYCSGMGYNVTSQMNFLLQSNASEIVKSQIFEQLRKLEITGCSKRLKRYICALLSPEVLNASVGALPPCRSTCQEIQSECSDVFQFVDRFLSSSAMGCKLTKKGEEYRGRQAKTYTGLTCQRWDAQKPHRHLHITPTTHPDNGLESNYCRNPDGKELGPWCYTTSKSVRWEFCNIDRCHTHLQCQLMPIPSSRSGCVDYQYDEKSDEIKGSIKGKPTRIQLSVWMWAKRLMSSSITQFGLPSV